MALSSKIFGGVFDGGDEVKSRIWLDLILKKSQIQPNMGILPVVLHIQMGYIRVYPKICVNLHLTKKWTGRRMDWSRINAQMSVYFADRMPD